MRRIRPCTTRACIVGREDELDCGCLGRGFTCQRVGTMDFCGLANECDPTRFDDTCDGGFFVFCNAGEIERVDCTQLGFAGCETQGDAACIRRF